jgi:pyruvate kinase
MDGTDAVMLSGETAVGRYPVKSVRAMAEVCTGAEKYQLPDGRTRHRIGDYFGRVDEAIAASVMYTANHLDVSAIIALTESGSTARWMSRIRSDIPIYALTPHVATSRRVSLYRGVFPVAFELNKKTQKKLYRNVFDALLSRELVSVGDFVIFTKGDLDGVSGSTNSMTIIEVTKPE